MNQGWRRRKKERERIFPQWWMLTHTHTHTHIYIYIYIYIYIRYIYIVPFWEHIHAHNKNKHPITEAHLANIYTHIYNRSQNYTSGYLSQHTQTLSQAGWFSISKWHSQRVLERKHCHMEPPHLSLRECDGEKLSPGPDFIKHTKLVPRPNIR